VLMHGGGFAQGAKEELCPEAGMLAKRGFVAVTINYRLGWSLKARLRRKWDSTFSMAIYRSVQDSKAAMRFLLDRASRYGIDTSWIFIGGQSAGAVAALYATYYKQTNWDKDFPWLKEKLGSIDNSSNRLKENYTVKGVLDMWGGMRDTTNISGQDASQTEILIFHGSADSIVSYTKSNNPERLGMGGYFIAQRYKHLGGYYELNTKINGGHGEDFSDVFITERMGAFFKSLFLGNFKSEEYATILKKGIDKKDAKNVQVLKIGAHP